MFEQLTKKLSSARHRLEVVARNYAGAHAALRARYTPRLLSLANIVAGAEKALTQAIKEHPEAFKKPKTRSLFGLRFGLRKKKGTIEVPDEEKTISLIEKHMPERLEDLVITHRSVSREALQRIPAGDLKKLGVRVVDDTDVPVVKPEDSEAEKLVKQALKDLGGDGKEG
jgi:hypothetical protein